MNGQRRTFEETQEIFKARFGRYYGGYQPEGGLTPEAAPTRADSIAAGLIPRAKAPSEREIGLQGLLGPGLITKATADSVRAGLKKTPTPREAVFEETIFERLRPEEREEAIRIKFGLERKKTGLTPKQEIDILLKFSEIEPFTKVPRYPEFYEDALRRLSEIYESQKKVPEGGKPAPADKQTLSWPD